MLQTKMKGNLSEWEEQYILHSLSELKLNYIDEKKKKTAAVDNEKSEASDKPNKKKDATSKSKPPSKSVKKPKKK